MYVCMYKATMDLMTHIDLSWDMDIFLKGKQTAFFNVVSFTSSPGDRLFSIVTFKLTLVFIFVR